MSLVNRLIKEAKAHPSHLTIQPNHVRTLAAHAHSLIMRTDKPTIEELEVMIFKGDMRMRNIPVQVMAG